VWLRARLPHLYESRDLPALLQALSRPSPRRSRSPNLERAVRHGERLAAALRMKDTCLFRALARFALLCRHREPDVEVGFHLGLPTSGCGAGHAWVTVNAAPFLEHEYSRFRCTYSFRCACT
jgi:hypothetical protein